jgi:hypothetical protein
VRIFESSRAQGTRAADVSAGTFVDWRSRARTLDGLAMYNVILAGETLWTIDGQPQVVRAASVRS